MTEHCTEEELIDLAVSDLDQGSLERISAHLAICEFCHQRYMAINDSVELVLMAAPQVAPPAGFSGSALAAMGVHPQPTPLAARAPNRTRLLVAVAALLGILAGAAGMGIVQAVRDQPESVQAAAGAITTTDGEQVGTVASGLYETEQVLVVTATGGSQERSYRCEVIMADGTRVDSGHWTLPAETTATWIIDTPAGEPIGMALVADNGQVWATAEL